MVLVSVGVQVSVPVGPPADKTSWLVVEDKFKAVNVGEEVVDRF